VLSRSDRDLVDIPKIAVAHVEFPPHDGISHSRNSV
jgi:hypothetical protein